MSHAEQLEWERSAGRPAGVAAIASALLGMIALVVANSTVRGGADDEAESIVQAHKHLDSLVLGGVLSALSMALMAPLLLYLFRATKYRRAELPEVARYLALAGPLLFAAGLVAQSFAIRDAVERTFERFPLPPKAAKDAANDAFTTGAVADWSLVLLGVGLVVGAATILISLNARRAGLLSSFMGITGVIVGVLIVVPFVGRPPIVYFFWAAALGLLYLGRWPGQRGRGPAWESGEPDPWPTTAELRAEQDAERLGRTPERAEPEPEPDDGDGDYEDAAPGAQHPRSKKRKRKRRR
ncbi:MAG TPA: hypothetical protein VJT75_17770 [Thermoleophilaceae bacterium]|nr:hypothetical protein [Thermoleophilaceae bacterium]